MAFSLVTKIIKCDVQKDIEYEWSSFVDGGNSCLYGIPHNARRVVEFNVEDKSIREIGPDLGDQRAKYRNGIKAENGSIYCLNSRVGIIVVPRGTSWHEFIIYKDILDSIYLTILA